MVMKDLTQSHRGNPIGDERRFMFRNTKSAWIQLKYVTRKFADPDVVKSQKQQQSQQPQQMGMPMKGIQIKEGFLTKQGKKTHYF